MMTTFPFELRIDPTVGGDIVRGQNINVDILAIGSRGLPLACPLCEYVGVFSCRLVTQSKKRVTREYQCPVCSCEITVTVQLK